MTDIENYLAYSTSFLTILSLDIHLTFLGSDRHVIDILFNDYTEMLGEYFRFFVGFVQV